jgi:hypothetical protein
MVSWFVWIAQDRRFSAGLVNWAGGLAGRLVSYVKIKSKRKKEKRVKLSL